jgi:CRP-like cAMP-binding protein
MARAKIPLSMPAHAIFMTQETEERAAEKGKELIDRQASALKNVDILRSLADKEIDLLASELRYAPFTAGEVMTRQGADAHWLYLIMDGTASVRVAVAGGLEREVARLKGGNFFGEMSLMTGNPREATVVAITDCECYRLGADSFKRVIKAHPEKAEEIAGVLAERRSQLEAVRQGLDDEARRKRAATEKEDLLDKIRDFFDLT